MQCNSYLLQGAQIVSKLYLRILGLCEDSQMNSESRTFANFWALLVLCSLLPPLFLRGYVTPLVTSFDW